MLILAHRLALIAATPCVVVLGLIAFGLLGGGLVISEWFRRWPENWRE